MLTDNFAIVGNFIMDHEDAQRRGTVTHDAGGTTRWGIASVYNPGVDVANLTLAGALAIYRQKYYLNFHLDQLRDARLAAKIADCLVNPGMGFAKTVQGLAGVPRDGAIGPITIGKLNLLDPINLINQLCEAQEAYYREHDADSPVLVGLLVRAADTPPLTLAMISSQEV